MMTTNSALGCDLFFCTNDLKSHFNEILNQTSFRSCGVTADFTASTTNTCTGEIVTFTNTSSGASSYVWKLNETAFTTTTNTLLSFGSSGSYDIELIADDGAGCLDSVTVTIFVDEAVNAGTDDGLAVCNTNDSINLNTLVSGDAGGTWQEITASGQFSPATATFDYTDLIPDDYIFDYIVSGSGTCPNDTATFTIQVKQQPNITLNLSSNSIDVSDSILIDFNTTGVFPTAAFLWSFCDGNLTTDTSAFYYSWVAEGNYCVCVDVNNGNNCTTTVCENNITVFDASKLSEIKPLNVNVFPNPTSELLNIDLSRLSGKVEIIIFDVMQKIIYQQTVSGGVNHIINIRVFESANYYVHIRTATAKSTLPIVFE